MKPCDGWRPQLSGIPGENKHPCMAVKIRTHLHVQSHDASCNELHMQFWPSAHLQDVQWLSKVIWKTPGSVEPASTQIIYMNNLNWIVTFCRTLRVCRFLLLRQREAAGVSRLRRRSHLFRHQPAGDAGQRHQEGWFYYVCVCVTVSKIFLSGEFWSRFMEFFFFFYYGWEC